MNVFSPHFFIFLFLVLQLNQLNAMAQESTPNPPIEEKDCSKSLLNGKTQKCPVINGLFGLLSLSNSKTESDPCIEEKKISWSLRESLKELLHMGKVVKITQDGDDSPSFHIPYQAIVLGKKDLEKIHGLEKEVFGKLQNKTQLYFLDEELIMDHLNKGALVLGIMSEDKLVAFLLLDFPTLDDPWHLGKVINLPQKELSRVAHFTMYMVHPDYRGFQFSQMLNTIGLKFLQKKSHNHLLATVAPNNAHSVKTILRSGFHIKEFKKGMYSDSDGRPLDRFVFYRNLKEKDLYFDPHVDKIKKANIKDLEKQSLLLGKGYVGYDIGYDEGDELIIYYGKKVSENWFKNLFFSKKNHQLN